MGSAMKKILHHTAIALLVLLAAAPARAADVNLNGVVGKRALVVIDGGKARWLTAGETSPEGVKLVSVDGDSAVIEIAGKRETLTMGQAMRLGPATGASSGGKSVVLAADGQGHFFASGAINGGSVRFLVDTGASFISMSSADAKRLGIDFTKGERAFTSTANGVVPTYRVKLDEVRVGDVSVTNVDGMVHTGNALPVVLLGMSFLNRMEMRREGEKMILTKRY
jgi:aspartyl protease family protein